MKRFGLICIILAFMFMGCMKIQKKDPVCERPGAVDSVICQVLADKGVSIKDVNFLFKGVNLALIKEDVYAKEDFLKFLDEVEGLLKSASSYENLAQYLITVVGNLNQDYKVEIVLLVEYFNDFSIAADISDFDRNLLLEHINQQRFIVGLLE